MHMQLGRIAGAATAGVIGACLAAWSATAAEAPKSIRIGYAISLSGVNAQGAAVTYKANLAGNAEVPPVNSPGRGTAQVNADTATNQASWRVEYTGLSGPATGAHIHCGAPPGGNRGCGGPPPTATDNERTAGAG